MRVRFLLLAIAASHLLSSHPGHAQPVPVGSEFQVNTYTSGAQSRPEIAGDGAGNFVVVWESYGSTGSDTDVQSVQGQRYDAAGTPQGSEFQVNTFTTDSQLTPTVTFDATGNFLVVWSSVVGPTGLSIQGQLYDGSGAPVGGEFQASSFTTLYQRYPAVASYDPANFVVVWRAPDYSLYGIGGRRFLNTAPQGPEFLVNTFTPGAQLYPAVAAPSGTGNFLVVWDTAPSGGSDTDGSVQGQLYDDLVAPVGTEFQVNTYTTGNQGFHGPAVAVDGFGRFVVVWGSDGSTGTDTSGSSIQGRRYDNDGTPLSAEFQVNTYTTDNQLRPTVAADASGDFVVVWSSQGSTGSDTDFESIQAQHFDGAGAPQGSEFQVNTYTTGAQLYPFVVAAGPASFVVAWQSDGSAATDDSPSSIQGQRFALPTTTSSSTTSSSTTSTTLPPTYLLPGRVVLIKPLTYAKFRAIPSPVQLFALPTSDPVAEGGSLRFYDTDTTAGDDTYPLPAGTQWKGLGTPPGSKGYKYSGQGTPADPCRVVYVKQKVIKAVCKGSSILLAPPFTGDIGIVLSLGTTDEYCAQFGGTIVHNTTDKAKRLYAPAPAMCP
jgi:hypothetical protein